MKSVKIEGKVVGYITQTKDGRWKSMTPKKAKLADHGSRHKAVKHIIKKTFDVEGQLYNMVRSEIARIDKKRRQ